MAAPRSQCLCVQEAARAWERIESMVEISVDVIIIASAQTIDFSLHSRNCQSHSLSSATVVKDTLLQIYLKLVDFLQRAITTYTGTAPLPDTPESSFKEAREQSSPWPLDHRSLESAVQKSDHQHGVVQAEQTPTVNVICVPSKMALGEHELDEQQSKYLALDIFCRTLRNLAGALQQIEGRETAEFRKVDARVLAILLQVTRILENASATLSTWASQIS